MQEFNLKLRFETYLKIKYLKIKIFNFSVFKVGSYDVYCL